MKILYILMVLQKRDCLISNLMEKIYSEMNFQQLRQNIYAHWEKIVERSDQMSYYFRQKVNAS